jgi:hypothetical protein
MEEMRRQGRQKVCHERTRRKGMKKRAAETDRLFLTVTANYFFFVAVFFAGAFFAVPHGPFDLQAMTTLLFHVVVFNVSQDGPAVNYSV